MKVIAGTYLKRVRDWVSGAVERLRTAIRPKDGAPDDAPSKRQEVVVSIVGSLVLVALIGTGAYLYISSRGDTGLAPRQEARGYTLTPPEGWTRLRPAPEGASVAFAAPTADTDATGELKAFISVQSAALNRQARTTPFETIADAYVQQLAKSYTDFQLVSTTSQTIDGIPAVLTTFTYSSDKTAVTSMSLFTVQDGLSYAVNGEALTSAWPQHAAQIEQALLTFRP